MTHKQKVTLARKNRTITEIKNRVPVFETAYWEQRKAKIREKASNSQMRKNK